MNEDQILAMAMHGLDPFVCDQDLKLIVRNFNYQTDQDAVVDFFKDTYPSKPIPRILTTPKSQSKKKVAILSQIQEGHDELLGFIIGKFTCTPLLDLKYIKGTDIRYLAVYKNLLTSDKMDTCRKYLFHYMINRHGEGDFLSAFPESPEDQTFFQQHGFRKVVGHHDFYQEGSMIRLNTEVARKLFRDPYFNPTRARSVLDDKDASLEEQIPLIQRAYHQQQDS